MKKLSTQEKKKIFGGGIFVTCINAFVAISTSITVAASFFYEIKKNTNNEKNYFENKKKLNDWIYLKKNNENSIEIMS